jgi:ParB-like chromosome segregation protein Spo0J
MASQPTFKTTIPAAKFSADIHAGNVVKAMTAAEAKGAKGEPFMAPLDAIRLYEGFNVRVTGTPASEAAMDELVQSIVANGFYNHKPIAVFVATDADANVLYVKDGHRRYEAVQRANKVIEAANAVEGATQRPLITALPVVASPAGSIEDMLIEMAQSNTGAPLTMFEKGLLAQRLIDNDMTKDDIAARLSMTERHLNNVLLLAKAPMKLRSLIVSDKVTPTTALKLMRDPATAAQKAADMVKASEAKGKTRAQPKDSGPRLVKTASTFEFKVGASIKDTLRDLAAFVRANVGHGEDDVITAALGSVAVTVATPAPAPEPKPAKAPKAPKPPKAEKPAKAAAAPKAPTKTAAQAKADAKAHLGTDKTGDTPAAKAAAGKPAKAPAKAAEDLSGL